MELSFANAQFLRFGLILLSGSLILTCLCEEDGLSIGKSPALTHTARTRFTAIKLFDFKRFKAVFKKSYASFAEEAARAKLFLGRAFRAFVSAVSYKHRKTSFYLAINQMSDWTPDEVRKIALPPERLVDVVKKSGNLKVEDESASEQTNPAPAISRDELETVLSTIVAHADDEPTMRLLAEELSKPLKLRRRRAIKTERNITLDDIAGEPVVEARDVGQRVASNNPHYEPPEQMSFGFSIGLPSMDSLSEQVSGLINATPGKEFISWVLQAASDALMTSADEDTEGDLPDKVFIDHRDECMFVPRNQGQCGSCYAFSSVSLLEWMYCKGTGKKVAFSEQYLMDCGGEFEFKGCNGGWPQHLPEFTRKYGVELRANYPYRGIGDQCPYDQSTPQSAIGFLRIHIPFFYYIGLDKFERRLKTTPLLVIIYVGSTFHEYGGGVHDGSDCEVTSAHAMLIVGSGREDNKHYWLIRNSHSVTYGEGGYYKLNKNATQCIATQGGFEPGNLVGLGRDRGVNLKYGPTPIKRRYIENVATHLKADIQEEEDDDE